MNVRFTACPDAFVHNVYADYTIDRARVRLNYRWITSTPATLAPCLYATGLPFAVKVELLIVIINVFEPKLFLQRQKIVVNRRHFFLSYCFLTLAR